MANRMPAVSGTFYPATAIQLKNEISELFKNAVKSSETSMAALIVPHAGYVFSGGVAASAYARLDRKQQYENIFIIGRSHCKNFNGVSIYPNGYYSTPLGEVQINTATASQLMESYDFIYYDKEADQNEHSLEVQLPFLQYWMENDFRIVPIIIGSDNPSLSKNLADALQPWFNGDNLFVISTDFSHYPAYETACKTDAETADAIVSNNGKLLRELCDKNKHSSEYNLLTGLCGAAAVQTLLHLTENKQEIAFEKIDYQNSGDVPSGDKNRVVGYWAIAVNRKEVAIEINASEKEQLLKLARESLLNHLNKTDIKQPKQTFTGIFNEPLGAFVSLKNGPHLRGCIGRFSPGKPLYQTIEDLSVLSATRDSRFQPVTPEEIDQLIIEISILTPLKKINSIHQILPGKHGIYIKKGTSSGTFLPQVATENQWTREEFLGRCSRDKAGIGWDGWRNAELYIYEAIVFSDKR